MARYCVALEPSLWFILEHGLDVDDMGRWYVDDFGFVCLDSWKVVARFVAKLYRETKQAKV